jgi:hypothetical protein
MIGVKRFPHQIIASKVMVFLFEVTGTSEVSGRYSLQSIAKAMLFLWNILPIYYLAFGLIAIILVILKI